MYSLQHRLPATRLRPAGIAAACAALVFSTAACAGPVASDHGKRPLAGLYSWVEAAATIVEGTVADVSEDALRVNTERVWRGTVPERRISVVPSWVESCTGRGPAFQRSERAVFFLGKRDGGSYQLVEPGAALRVRGDRAAVAFAMSRLLRIATLPDEEKRAHAVIALLESKNAVLRRAAKEFIFAHFNARDDADRHAGQLIGMLSSRDPEVRMIAASALQRAKTPAVVRPLIRATRDPDPKVVEAASNALAKFDSTEAIQALLALFKHPNPRVRIRAYLDVDRHVRGDVVAALTKALDDPDPSARGIAATALIYAIRERKAAAALLKLRVLLVDPNDEVRGRAARALGETRDPQLVSAFFATLGDRPTSAALESDVICALALLPWDDETVRAAARRHLPRLTLSLWMGHRATPATVGLIVSAGTPEARQVLQQAAETHPIPEVREHAAYGLKLMQPAT